MVLLCIKGGPRSVVDDEQRASSWCTASRRRVVPERNVRVTSVGIVTERREEAGCGWSRANRSDSSWPSESFLLLPRFEASGDDDNGAATLSPTGQAHTFRCPLELCPDTSGIYHSVCSSSQNFGLTQLHARKGFSVKTKKQMEMLKCCSNLHMVVLVLHTLLTILFAFSIKQVGLASWHPGIGWSPFQHVVGHLSYGFV